MGDARLLLIDTCGDPAGVALSEGDRLRASETLPGRRASAEIVVAIERVLASLDWRLRELQGIGVVRGPGSFTGVRTGLSVAKGLAEAAKLPLFAVSRLAVLASRDAEGFVALDAGRGEVYARDLRDGRESLLPDAALIARAGGCSVTVAEESLLKRLAPLQPRLRPLEMGLVLPVVRGQMSGGGVDVAAVDALYLRGESEIYTRAAVAAEPEAA